MLSSGTIFPLWTWFAFVLLLCCKNAQFLFTATALMWLKVILKQHLSEHQWIQITCKLHARRSSATPLIFWHPRNNYHYCVLLRQPLYRISEHHDKLSIIAMYPVNHTGVERLVIWYDWVGTQRKQNCWWALRMLDYRDPCATCCGPIPMIEADGAFRLEVQATPLDRTSQKHSTTQMGSPLCLGPINLSWKATTGE